jgi:hypothetical protein
VEAWVITPIPSRIRIAKAAFPLVISVGLASWLWWLQYENNVLSQNWYIPAALPLAGLWTAYRLYRSTERRELAYEWEAIPFRVRIKRGSLIFGAVLLLCGLAWSMQYSSDQLGTYWWYVWPVAIPGMIWATFELLRARKKVLVPEAQLENERLGSEQKLREQAAAQHAAEQEERWYFRYPVAALMLFGAYWIVEKKEQLWWVGLLLVVVAAFQARELSLLIVAALVIYLLFQGPAALPVSIAIVVGAIIIANALRK